MIGPLSQKPESVFAGSLIEGAASALMYLSAMRLEPA